MNEHEQNLKEKLMSSYVKLLEIGIPWNSAVTILSSILFTTTTVHFMTREGEEVKEIANELIPLTLEIADRARNRTIALNKCFDALKGARKDVDSIISSLSKEL